MQNTWDNKEEDKTSCISTVLFTLWSILKSVFLFDPSVLVWVDETGTDHRDWVFSTWYDTSDIQISFT